MQKIKEKLYLGNLEDVVSWSKKPDNDSKIIIYFGQIIPDGLGYNCYPTLIHIPLQDGKNLLQKLANAIQISFSIVDSYEGDIVIACRAGLSRSVIMTTSIYALTENINFGKAYKKVKEKVPQALPNQKLLSQAKEIVEELKCYI